MTPFGVTPRELQILLLLGAGLSNKQIAARLRISGLTVRNHLSNIYVKLGVHDRTSAVVKALRTGLIDQTRP